MRHENNGFCMLCHKIIDRYPGFNENLKSWFMNMQHKHPETHTSCAGRGRLDQESYFARGATRAHWAQSAHNYNAALDLFVIDPKTPSTIYPKEWFQNVLSPALPKFIEWYGEAGSRFYELPHVEIRGWPELVKNSAIFLVEDVSGSEI